MADIKPMSDVLDVILNHLDWCLSNYQDNNSCGLDCGHDNKLEPIRPDWTYIRALQNNLYGFLDQQEESQATAIASLLIYIIDKTFSDLCAATPWDNNGVIDDARVKAHNALLDLLKAFKEAIKSQSEMDAKLWVGFRSFEIAYNSILSEVNQKDQSMIGIGN